MIRSNEIVQLSASVYTCESVSDTIHQRNASGGFFSLFFCFGLLCCRKRFRDRFYSAEQPLPKLRNPKATTRFLSTYKRPARFFQQAHKSRPPFHFLVFRGNDALTKTFALVSGPVDEHLRGDDVAEGHEHLHELGVTELLWQVVDEQVAALGS
uniref:Uncharacterized protein n=1 Tax=Vespula pensylvanica TaxID=30213 RepID=A0A834KRK9_VESPE|nr:hypothetical protein H0235_013198 [Vespula pensylvanica]